jgi:hypothetical protein
VKIFDIDQKQDELPRVGKSLVNPDTVGPSGVSSQATQTHRRRHCQYEHDHGRTVVQQLHELVRIIDAESIH